MRCRGRLLSRRREDGAGHAAGRPYSAETPVRHAHRSSDAHAPGRDGAGPVAGVRGDAADAHRPGPGDEIRVAPARSPAAVRSPTVSDSLLSKLDHGDIVVRPNIDRFDGDRVCFTDGSAEQIDAVIYCTGYKISFPFLDEALIGADGGQIPLYHRIVPPKLPGLYFIGLVQPIGAIMPIAEIQSEWAADLLQGRATLPPEPQMNREIARYRAMTTRRYARSTRDTIQVDFLAYRREIRRERRMGARRSRVSRQPLPGIGASRNGGTRSSSQPARSRSPQPGGTK